MKIELLISQGCPFCHEAEKVWRTAAAERQTELHLLDVSHPDGQLTQSLTLNTVPAVLIDGTLKGVGVQTIEDARQLLNQSLPK